VRDFSHRKVQICHSTVKPPIEYKQIIKSQLKHGEISKCKGQKRIANLEDFFSKKSKFADSLEIIKGSFKMEHFL
jgi:hypothetical protein